MQKKEFTGLILLTGEDAPGITESLFTVLSPFAIVVRDIEQIVVRGRLILTILISLNKAHAQALQADLESSQEKMGVDIAIDFSEEPVASSFVSRALLHVTVIGESLRPLALAEITGRISGTGANIERIYKTADETITALEFVVSGSSQKELRSSLAQISPELEVDVAVQSSGVSRSARKLIVMDVDSTLIQQEVIDLLAAMAGVGTKVKEITDSAMRGELDFEASLRARVSLLKGLPATAINEVQRQILLTSGARTLIRTLHELGHAVGVVSGGFVNVIEPLLQELGIRHLRANQLEIVDGVITGNLIGPIIDRAAKAQALRDFASEVGVTMDQTIAVGDGANDLDMIAQAGLGVAFNAKPAVRAAADSALSHPHLDNLLYFMGIPRQDFKIVAD